MKTRRILSTILALTMLLTLFSGEFASAAGRQIIAMDEELAYEPLAETASVAYEQHDAGYAISLDRAADSVTMNVTAVPGSRSADKARLYVRTGVALKAGVAYRVSFSLASEKKLADYTVNFDGDTAAAYGKLDKRSIEAGATDRVEYTVTPKAASGELVLRLLLGKTEVNTLRFSNLAVEESPANQSGANKMLVDKLNYAAPGAIRCAAEAGYSAEMSSTDTSATMSITNVPSSKDAAVWKLKLMVATGLKPEPGKTYRFRATLNSNNSGSYEACYNEGEVEKGYDVLYNQSLKRGNQTVERMIYVPTDKENPGELIVQFSLGKLSKGTKVTVSKVTVEEASPAYTSALARGFALDATDTYTTYEKSWDVQKATTVVSKVDLGKAEVWSDSPHVGSLRVLNGAATMTFKDIGTEAGQHNSWDASLHINTFEKPLAAGADYWRFYISFKINTELAYSYTEVKCGISGVADKYGVKYGLPLPAGESTVVLPCNRVGINDDIEIEIQLGDTTNENRVTVSDVKILRPIQAVQDWKAQGDFQTEYNPNGTTEVWGGWANTLSFDDATRAAALTWTAGGSSASYSGKLVFNTNYDMEPGKAYRLSYTMTVTGDPSGSIYEVKFNGHGKEELYGKVTSIPVETASETIGEGTVFAYVGGKLQLQFDLGNVPQDVEVTISNISLQEGEVVGEALKEFHKFNAAWQGNGSDTYTTKEVTKYEDRIEMAVNCGSDATREAWKAKLYIPTGVVPRDEEDYQITFNMWSDEEQLIHIYLTRDGMNDDQYFGDRFFVPIAANSWTPVTITTRARRGNGCGDQITMQFLLGMIPAGTDDNNFKVKDIKVEEVDFWRVHESKITGAVTNDMQEGYTVPLTRAKDSATVSINKTPATGMEAWKHKLFLDTGVNVNAGEAYRVVFDTLAENDMDFEVCYNRGSTEKGFAAIYGLHAAAGKAKTVEKMVFAEGSGKLIVQLSLGNVPAPNKVTVSNLRVERVKYSYSGKSALPAEISYQAGDVSYWAHADYAASFTNTADSITAHITPPAKSPEPWKVKLFLDTGVALQGGKYYKVTADVSAKKSQNYEICYNNGGIEFGYDSMGGLKVTGGKTERIEKLISVPAGKKDTNNLMLQFNLGKTAIANDVTISNVTVEEVTLAYANAMGKDFSYQKSLSTWTDPKTTYKAIVESANSAATLHISDVPASGTGVWMVKLFVHTGAMLEAGKSYQVSADLLAAKAQDFETCFNNEETEKGFDAIYGQKLAAGVKTTVDKRISVPASMTDAGELVLQFSVGGAVANDITVSNISVQELQYGGSGDASPVPDTVIDLSQSAQAAGTLDVSREKLTYHMTKIAAGAKDNAIKIAGAALRPNDLYTVAFTAKADKELTGTLALAPSGGKAAVISEQFTLTPTEQTYAFTTADALADGGDYDIFWQFGSADNQKLGSADVDLSNISVYVPAEHLSVSRSVQKVTVNGKAVSPDVYSINGFNYFKLRDLAVLLNGTNGQFVVRYNGQTNAISLTSGKEYTPIGGELAVGADLSARCLRSSQTLSLNGRPVSLKAFSIGGYNYFRLRDLGTLLGFDVDYEAKTNTVLIASPLTPERQEASYAYNVFFRPEIDGESQPYVGDTMPFYDNGTYYIYYLKEGGDSYNHSVYLTTTRDFVSYQEYDDPVLSASRADVQDSWIGTGSVVKVDKNYYFFYTGFNASGSQEYHEKIMVAKGSSPTSFTKVGGWSITPPAELNQKNDFRDPQAYYDPATGTISLTVTASKDGTARILKYTLGKDLSSVKYDGVIFTDPAGAFYNLECSDTFRLGNKWYLTYSGQEDTLWYASADSRFGPYSAPKRMDGTIFYAAKHVENGKNSYMVGWTRRSASASSTDEVSGWGGNLAVQQLRQNADGSLSMIPADSIASAFSKSVASSATSATLTAGSGYSYKKAFTSSESFKLTGEFTCAGTGSLGLAFDFDGTEDQYKLISVDPAEGKLRLLFNGGATQIAETQAKVAANQKHTFTYIQDGSVGIFYLDGQAALTVRLYGVTDKPIYLFAENNSVTFTSLRQFTR